MQPKKTKQSKNSKLRKIPTEFRQLANWQQLLLDSEEGEEQPKGQEPIKATVIWKTLNTKRRKKGVYMVVVSRQNDQEGIEMRQSIMKTP